jgi:hypothetical protein
VLTGIDGSPITLCQPRLAGSANPILHEQFLQVLARASAVRAVSGRE